MIEATERACMHAVERERMRVSNVPMVCVECMVLGLSDDHFQTSQSKYVDMVSSNYLTLHIHSMQSIGTFNTLFLFYY